jgi:hypothetical protein
MIDPDINQVMAGIAPSQTNYTPSDARAPGAAGDPEPESPDSIFRSIDAARRPSDFAMKNALLPATQVNPDEAARAKTLGAQIGVAPDVVMRNGPEAKRRAFMQDINRRRLAERDPKLAEFLSRPDNAMIAHDDIDALEATKVV